MKEEIEAGDREPRGTERADRDTSSNKLNHNGQAPSYLSDLFKPFLFTLRLQGCYSSQELKRSQQTAGSFPIVPSTSGTTSLLIRLSDSAEAFKSKLKTHLYVLTSR